MEYRTNEITKLSLKLINELMHEIREDGTILVHNVIDKMEEVETYFNERQLR